MNICSKDGGAPPTDAEICTQKQWDCGVGITTYDSCENRRDGIQCGNATCGVVTGQDPCTTATAGRTENCGSCNANQN